MSSVAQKLTEAISNWYMTFFLCMTFYFHHKKHESGNGDISACSDILYLRSHPFHLSAQLGKNSKES